LMVFNGDWQPGQLRSLLALRQKKGLRVHSTNCSEPAPRLSAPGVSDCLSQRISCEHALDAFEIR